MKGIYLMIVLYVPTLGILALNESPVADIPTKCPVNPRNETVLLPHETDCTKFYNCHLGKKGEPINCPFMDTNGNRLHFNPRLQVCDWPWSAGCQSSSTSTITSPTTPSPTTPTPTTPSSTTPTPTTSSPTTPTPTTPSPTTPTPTTPTPTTPSPTTPTPTTPTPTTPSPTTPTLTTPTPTTLPSNSSSTTESTSTLPGSCASDGRLHMIPHKNMCDYYYLCFNGIINPVPRKCDRDLLFNPLLRVCDYPENVNCHNIIPPSKNNVPSTRSLITTSMPSYSPSNTVSAKLTSIGPAAWTCERNGRRYKVPHERWCNYFYWCVDGKLGTEPVKCESYLLFNPVIGECDFPENVDCNGRIIPPTTPTPLPTRPTTPSTKPTTPPTKPTTPPTKPTTPSTKPTTPSTKPTTLPTTTRDPTKPREKCPPKGSTEKARLPHPCLCNQYYECVDGEPILETCPIGDHFDYIREVCDMASIVKCVRPIPTNDITSDDYDDYDTMYTCAPEGRAFQHETDCTAYYVCSKGEKILKHCVEGLHFNITIQMCDYPLKKCALSTSLPIISLDACPPIGFVMKALLPHECECTQYYECNDGKQILRNCPAGLHYDHVRQICNKPTEAKCTTFVPIVPTTMEMPTSDPSKCYDENSKMPHEYNCGSYYTCSSGKKILKTCPKNLHFNPMLYVCDYPENVNCNAESENEPVASKDTKCRTSTGITKIPHETDCNLYYVCENGISTLKKCHSAELVFNPVLKVCDFPENSFCSMTRVKNDLEQIDRAMIPNLDPSTCIGTCPDEDPEYAVLLPNDDCKKYCMCSNGVAWVMPCPEPLYFDSVEKICKLKKNAVCGKRSYDQDDTIDKIDNGNSMKSMTNENNNEYKTYDNLDPSTCIGTCPDEDPEYAVLLPNVRLQKVLYVQQWCSMGHALP
ncbi:uncharacterized protein LOC112552591 [Pogonomyrmex barbatus]|uniref:Uncharacterized protein LOC112552591 n=1 Tax=Pogonomyrmex barbatus TaxID=144034 RepID=A0A8N1S7K0_9HYME|nr:uncharacterized protein LOC112552591 [Pogonomyrmex barbatus]